MQEEDQVIKLEDQEEMVVEEVDLEVLQQLILEVEVEDAVELVVQV